MTLTFTDYNAKIFHTSTSINDRVWQMNLIALNFFKKMLRLDFYPYRKQAYWKENPSVKIPKKLFGQKQIILNLTINKICAISKIKWVRNWQGPVDYFSILKTKEAQELSQAVLLTSCTNIQKVHHLSEHTTVIFLKIIRTLRNKLLWHDILPVYPTKIYDWKNQNQKSVLEFLRVHGVNIVGQSID